MESTTEIPRFDPVDRTAFYGDEEPTPFDQVLVELSDLDFRVFDKEWVAILVDSLISEFGHADDDPDGTAWVHRVLGPILCLVRQKYRAAMELKDSRNYRAEMSKCVRRLKGEVDPRVARGIERAKELAPNVGDRFTASDAQGKVDWDRIRHAINKSPLFEWRPPIRGFVERVEP